MSNQRLRWRRKQAGFSLIELLVVLAIIAVLLGLGFPALTEWMVNNQIRNQAEYVRYGLQIARSEAINRNRFVRFQMVFTMDGTCTTLSTSNLWIVSHGDPTTATQPTVAWADANGVTQVPADANIRCARDRSVMIPDYLLNATLADTSPANNPIIIQKGEREGRRRYRAIYPSSLFLQSPTWSRQSVSIRAASLHASTRLRKPAASPCTRQILQPHRRKSTSPCRPRRGIAEPRPEDPVSYACASW